MQERNGRENWRKREREGRGGKSRREGKGRGSEEEYLKFKAKAMLWYPRIKFHVVICIGISNI